jgi:hypothetical protein
MHSDRHYDAAFASANGELPPEAYCKTQRRMPFCTNISATDPHTGSD